MSKELAKTEPKAVTTYGDLLGQYNEEEVNQLMETTGTENKPEAERRPPIYFYNVETLDEAGEKITPDMFWNPQTGEQFEKIRCAIVGFKEIRQRDHRDMQTGLLVIDCRSFDRRSGIETETNREIVCEKCEYRYGKRGERKECTLHMRFMCWDLDRQQFFAYMAKRSGYISTNRYLERTFFKQLVNPKTRKRSDIPLYMLETRITLKPEQGAGRIYYVPSYECGGPLPKEVVVDLMPAASTFKKLNTQEDMEQLDGQIKKGQRGELQYNEEEPPAPSDEDIPF